jgi:acyl-CoA reductase-like NAD-dependent aldehyde dehydrogenase
MIEKDSTVVPLIVEGSDEVITTTFAVISPATGRTIHYSTSASVSSACKAVAAAGAAFQVWSCMKPAARRNILFKVADIAEARKDELITTQVEETAITRDECEFGFNAGLEILRDFAGRSLALQGSVPLTAEDGQSAMIVKEPYGVVLSIVPWYERFKCFIT